MGGQEEPGLEGGKTIVGVVVRIEVEEVGGGSGVASVVDQEVSDTAPNLQVSIGIPLRNSTHTPARSPPVVENGAPDKRLTGGVEGLKRLGIGWCWARGEAGRGYDWVKIIFALGGYFVTFRMAPRHRVEC